MTSPKHLWSGEWARESESSADDMARRRDGLLSAQQPGDETPTEPEPQPREPRTPLLVRAWAAFVAAWRSLVAGAGRSLAAIGARLRTISARQVGLTLLATVCGAAVALGAAALAGGSGNHSNTPEAGATSGHAWLGVQTVSQMGAAGATVLVVDAGGPAQRAGVVPGDVITQVDGQPVQTPGALNAAVDAKQPGQQVQLLVDRYGQSLVLYATLGSSHGGP
jgi:membrane-associated protease RseP (regulator of RpoE activity)